MLQLPQWFFEVILEVVLKGKQAVKTFILDQSGLGLSGKVEVSILVRDLSSLSFRDWNWFPPRVPANSWIKVDSVEVASKRQCRGGSHPDRNRDRTSKFTTSL